MKIAALGRTGILYNSIWAVSEAGYDLCSIITAEAAPEYERTAEDFRRLAGELDVEFKQIDNINAPENALYVQQLEADIAISINWPTLIGSDVRNAFTHGVVNCHAGDLPQYRGNAATNWAIINDEDEIVVTLHYMDDDLDSGEILYQRPMPINKSTRIADVYDFMCEEVPEMYVQVLEKVESGEITPRAQPEDPNAALRCYPRIPEDSRIKWSESAESLDRLVRASSEPLPGAYTFHGTEKLVVWRAHAEASPMPYLGTPGQVAERRPSDGEVAVITGDGFLVLEELETEELGRVEACEAIRSHRDRLGMHTPEEITALVDRVERLERRLEELRARTDDTD